MSLRLLADIKTMMGRARHAGLRVRSRDMITTPTEALTSWNVEIQFAVRLRAGAMWRNCREAAV